MRFRLSYLLLWCFLLGASIQAHAGLLRSLDDVWLVYNPDLDTYVPATLEDRGRVTNISAWLDLRRDAYQLHVDSKAGTCLLIERDLYWVATPSDTVLTLSLRSLFDKYGKKELFITLYHPEGLLPWSRVFVVNGAFNSAEHLVQVNKTSHRDLAGLQLMRVLPRVDKAMPDTLLVVLLLVIGVIVMVRYQNPKIIEPLYNLREFALPDTQLYATANRRITNVSILLLGLVFTLVLGAILFLLNQRVNQDYSRLTSLFVLPHFRIGPAVEFLNFSLLVAAYLLAKFLLISFSASLFDLRKAQTPHYYEFFRSVALISLVLLVSGLLVFVAGAMSVATLQKIAIISVAGCFLVRIVKLVIVLKGLTGFHTLYLFAYLCVTELLPMALLARVFSLV